MTPDPLPYAEHSRHLKGLNLRVIAAGEAGRPLVILLHGFPHLWPGWHFQIAPLVAAGFRVVVPNQRGYGKSDKPPGIAAYDIDHLADDVIALADSEGCTAFYLVEHDWGGIVAWRLAGRFPRRVAGMVILNAPHPGIVQPYLLRHPGQMLKSWYVGLFQLPWLPEAILSAHKFGSGSGAGKTAAWEVCVILVK